MKENSLSADTFYALRHTAVTTAAISEYFLADLNFKYVLTGKLLSDPLEKFFGTLRQMFGGNYYISTQQ